MFHSHTHIRIITIDGRINLEKFKSKVCISWRVAVLGSPQPPSPGNKYTRLCRAQVTGLFKYSNKASANISTQTEHLTANSGRAGWLRLSPGRDDNETAEIRSQLI